MAESRLARELDGRTANERPKSWQPSGSLPEPEKQPGYSYRWVRVATLAQADPRNISSKLREGYEPVRIEEQPQFKLIVDPNSRFKDNIEVGGLLLCKIPDEFIKQRKQYYSGLTKAQQDTVDNNLMKENDPRMPIFKEKKTKVSFGKGK